MKNGNLAKLYDRLTPQERFEAIVSAYARDDDLEAQRLGESAPWKSYRMRDAAFVERIELAKLAVYMWCLLWHDSAAPWLMRQSVRMLTGSLEDPWSNEKGKLEKGIPREKWPDHFRQLVDRLTEPEGDLLPFLQEGAELVGLWLGFVRFSEAVGVEAETLLRAFTGPMANRILGTVDYLRLPFPSAFPDYDGEGDGALDLFPSLREALEETAANTERVLLNKWPGRHPTN